MFMTLWRWCHERPFQSSHERPLWVSRLSRTVHPFVGPEASSQVAKSQFYCRWSEPGQVWFLSHIINHSQPFSTIINQYQPISTTINHYQPLLTTIRHWYTPYVTGPCRNSLLVYLQQRSTAIMASVEPRNGSSNGHRNMAIFPATKWWFTMVFFYVYQRLYIYIHILQVVYTWVHMRKRSCIHIYIYTYVYIHIHTYTYIYIHIHTYTYIYIHIHTYTYIYIYIHTYTYIYIYIHTHTYIYIYIHIHIYIYTYIYIHTYIYIYL